MMNSTTQANEWINFSATVRAFSFQFQDMSRAIRAARTLGETRGTFPEFNAYWRVNDEGISVWALDHQWCPKPW